MKSNTVINDFLIRSFNVVQIGVLLLGFNNALANDGCWINIFDEPGFKGMKTRITGPVELPTLTKLPEYSWNDRIDSLEVGPLAQVTVYRNENFEVPQEPVNHSDAIQLWKARPEDFRGAIQTFYAGHKIHHLGEFDLHSQISSLKITCVK